MTPRTKASASRIHSSARRRGHEDRHDQRHRRHADDAVDHLLARVGHRPSGHELLEFGEGDRRTGEGDGADQDAEQDLEDDVGRRVRST